MTSDTNRPAIVRGATALRAKSQSARRAKHAAPTIDKRTTSILFVLAFVLTFAISFGLFHYQETIASALSADGISWEVAERGETNPVTSVAADPRQQRFAVQVAAYESRAQAEALAQHLSARHELVTIAPADINGTMYYRVRIPVETGGDADRLAARLRRQLGVEAWVVYRP